MRRNVSRANGIAATNKRAFSHTNATWDQLRGPLSKPGIASGRLFAPEPVGPDSNQREKENQSSPKRQSPVGSAKSASRLSAASLFDEASHVSFGIAGIPTGCVFSDFLQRATRRLSIIAAKFAEEFAHGPSVALGKGFWLLHKFGRETDGVNVERCGSRLHTPYCSAMESITIH
jgi:hypothetical protein